MKDLNIIILAAGIGKRMRSKLPKVLHPIGGSPMLERVIKTAEKLKPKAIYVVHNKQQGAILKDHLDHLKVIWVEQKSQLGTGDAVKHAAELLSDASQNLILYGDVPLISKKLLEELLKTAGDALGLITANLDDPSCFGRILRDTSGKVRAIVEQKDASLEQQNITEINTGIIAAPTNLLHKYLPLLQNNNQQKEYYLTDIIGLAAKDQQPIHSVTTTNKIEILGVNDKYQLAQLERYYQHNIAKELMLQGLTILDPERFDLRGTLEFGTDVTIDVNTVIKGKVTIGNNVQILPNCVLEDTIIEDNCVIGPFARIRPGSHIKQNAKVGNFVETKNSVLGENSKANHLSYLGDSTIGSNVNIGAGTITCNYDGVNKHHTIIKDNAFIGSNSSLVAPVTIGKNATIGAGSTITKKAPDEQLTIARQRQCTIKNWQRPRKK